MSDPRRSSAEPINIWGRWLALFFVIRRLSDECIRAHAHGVPRPPHAAIFDYFWGIYGRFFMGSWFKNIFNSIFKKSASALIYN